MTTENNPASAAVESSAGENAAGTVEPKRQGFAPSLSLLTLAVILGVLWFCPLAFRWIAEKSIPSAVDDSANR